MFGGFGNFGNNPAISQAPAKPDATEVTLCPTCKHECWRDRWAKLGRYCARDGHSVESAVDHGKCQSEDPQIPGWYEAKS